MTILQNLSSKKFWVVVALILINGLNDTLGLNLSHDTIMNITEGGSIYVIVQGIVDAVKAYMVKHTAQTITASPEVAVASLPQSTPAINTNIAYEDLMQRVADVNAKLNNYYVQLKSGKETPESREAIQQYLAVHNLLTPLGGEVSASKESQQPTGN